MMAFFGQSQTGKHRAKRVLGALVVTLLLFGLVAPVHSASRRTRLRLGKQQLAKARSLHANLNGTPKKNRREKDYLNATRRYALDPELVRAVIEVESAWNPRARSRKGALGLMQLMPATGARYGVRDPFDPRENISGGTRHLRFLLNRFGGDRRLALAAYNAGENAVDANRGVPPYRETRLYLERVETIYGKLRAGRIPRIGRIYKLVDQNGRTVFVND